jgi:hypothetical protein
MAQSMAHCAKNGALMSSERPVGCETEFFQPSESAGKNLMAAGKNKKNPVIFSAIQCDLVKFFKSRVTRFRGLLFFCHWSD